MESPYLSHRNCVKRLWKEYIKHKSLIVACDFDDTVWPFHNQADTHKLVLNLLKDCSDLGFHIVIYTASKPERFDFMRRTLENAGIRVASVNKNAFDLPYGNDGKIYYNILLCDRAGLASSFKILNSIVKRAKKTIDKK